MQIGWTQCDEWMRKIVAVAYSTPGNYSGEISTVLIFPLWAVKICYLCSVIVDILCIVGLQGVSERSSPLKRFGIPVIFTLSSFEYSPIKWKCRGRFSTAWFTQNGWASAVDSTGDFLNSAQLPPFVRVTGNYWFCTKSLLTKRLHAQFVVLRQFLTTKLKNNVSKMLIVKNRTVIDYLQSPDTKTRDDEKWRHFRKAAFLFSEWIGLLKTWESENDG